MNFLNENEKQISYIIYKNNVKIDQITDIKNHKLLGFKGDKFKINYFDEITDNRTNDHNYVVTQSTSFKNYKAKYILDKNYYLDNKYWLLINNKNIDNSIHTTNINNQHFGKAWLQIDFKKKISLKQFQIISLKQNLFTNIKLVASNDDSEHKNWSEL